MVKNLALTGDIMSIARLAHPQAEIRIFKPIDVVFAKSAKFQKQLPAGQATRRCNGGNRINCGSGGVTISSPQVIGPTIRMKLNPQVIDPPITRPPLQIADDADIFLCLPCLQHRGQPAGQKNQIAVAKADHISARHPRGYITISGVALIPVIINNGKRGRQASQIIPRLVRAIIIDNENFVISQINRRRQTFQTLFRQGLRIVSGNNYGDLHGPKQVR